MFEKKVLRRVFGPKKEERTKGWRKFNNEELCNYFLYLVLIISRMGDGGRTLGCIED
jgi:hypothetical protein